MGLDFSAMLDEDTRRRKVEEEETVVDAVYDGSELSLETVKPKFRDLVTGLDIMVARANRLVVDSDGSLKDATALGVDAKRIAKLIDAKRKDVIGPYSEFVSSVNNFCSGFTEKLVLNARKTNPDSIEGVLKGKISAYQAKVELERRKREEAAKRAAAELQAKLDAEAAEANRKAEEEARQKAAAEAQARGAGALETASLVQDAVAEAKANAIEAPSVPDPVVPQASGPVRAENGGTAYGATSWVCVVVDPALVPREFCAPVQKLLNDAVKQGVRTIPGCEIKEETSVRFRR